jgi:hypothetical protein
LRRHESEWHVAPVRSLHEPAHAPGRKSHANTDRKSDSNRHCYSYRDRHSYSDADCDGDSNCYCNTNRNSYGYGYAHSKTDTDPKRRSNAKASPDAPASFVIRIRKVEDLIWTPGTHVPEPDI